MIYYAPFPPHGDIAQLVERLNGIEKVRGSTPLISTIRFRVQNKGFPRFLLCAAVRPDRGVKGVLIHFNTLRRVQCPSGRKVCAHGKTEANGVGVGQPRPLVLLCSTPRRKEAAERAAPRPGRKVYPAGRPPAQDGNVAPRRRRKSEKVNQATCSQIRNMI